MNKKIWIAVIALVAVVALMVGVWFATRPKVQEGSKTITVAVVHKDGTRNEYTIQTDAETLAEAMNEENLLGEDVEGMYYTVDGETTDYNINQSWWKLNKNGQMCMDGANTAKISDGDVFEWVYTIG
jgi:hypothetical protein